MELTERTTPPTLPLTMIWNVISNLITDWMVSRFSVRRGMESPVSYTSSSSTRSNNSCGLQLDGFWSPPAMKSRSCCKYWSLSMIEIQAMVYS